MAYSSQSAILPPQCICFHELRMNSACLTTPHTTAYLLKMTDERNLQHICLTLWYDGGTGGEPMKFKLIIDKTKEEQVAITVHECSSLTEQIEALVMRHTGTDRITAYAEDEMKQLSFHDIECITVLDGKTYAIDTQNKRYRLKQRLYELEESLPSTFIRINKSTLANEKKIERFATYFSGAVDAVFQCGYREYVSRRCFTEIRRRYDR